MIKGDAEARRMVADFLHDHSVIFWDRVEPAEIEKEELTFSKIRQLPKSWLLAAACVALLAIGAMIFRPDAPETVGNGTAESPGLYPVHSGSVQGTVARVTRVNGMANDGDISSGTLIEPGKKISMPEGLIELVFQGSGVFWGQPAFPLFLTHQPDQTHISELQQLKRYLEEHLKGTFSISRQAIWKTHP